MIKKIRVLFLDILSDDENLRKKLEQHVQGGIPYGEIYERAFHPLPVAVTTVNATKPFSIRLRDFDAILIGGSAHDPSQAPTCPWMHRFAETIQDIHGAKIPTLGVCGGHEFIADALGGVVGENTAGREVGAIPVTLTEEGRHDFLFEHLPDTFLTMLSHGHDILIPPENAVRLAHSRMTPIQALAIGDSIRTVQFHPEFSNDWLRRLIAFRKQDLAPDLFQDTSATRVLFHNFIKHYFR